MNKKDNSKKPFNFLNESPLVQQTEQTVVTAYDRIESGGQQTQPRTPAYHKEPTRDILVHCPVSLHTRLTELKQHRRDEYGLRETINDYAVQAIAAWLDTQEKSMNQ